MATGEVADGRRSKICTVIGGRSSFVGRSLVSMLLRSSAGWTVRIADSGPSLALDPTEMENKILADSRQSGRLFYFQVDIRDGAVASSAIRGSSVVFYMNMLDSSAQNFHEQYTFVVKGTKNVINTCHECKVERLIYNSCSDVVFDGLHDISHGNESLQYPSKFEDVFCDLKVQAEAMILSANSASGLSTCVLRPCNPFGPADPYLVPSLVRMATSGWSQFFIGIGMNLCDYTYVDNIAHAHVCAENALCSGKASVAGEAFFITNLEPVKSGEFAAMMLGDLGFPCFRPSFSLPRWLVLFILSLCKKLANSGERVAFLRSFFCTKSFDCSKAKKFIGYSPIVSLEDGIVLTAESFPHLVKDSPAFSEISKADAVLGSGTVAEILLWRDERKSFFCVLGLFLLFYWFFLSGRTLITSAAELLFLASVILFGYCHLPSSLLGSRSEKISPAQFELSETSAKFAVTWLLSMWNRWVHMLYSIARGDDLALFVQTAAALYLFKLLVELSPALFISSGLAGLFTIFIIYEQHEDIVDRFVRRIATKAGKVRKFLLAGLTTSA